MKFVHELEPTALSEAGRLTTRITDTIELFRVTLIRLRCAASLRLLGREILTLEVKLHEGP